MIKNAQILSKQSKQFDEFLGMYNLCNHRSDQT